MRERQVKREYEAATGEGVKCERDREQERGDQRQRDLNWQSQPRLPVGTVVCLELGMSLGNQL